MIVSRKTKTSIGKPRKTTYVHVMWKRSFYRHCAILLRYLLTYWKREMHEQCRLAAASCPSRPCLLISHPFRGRKVKRRKGLLVVIDCRHFRYDHPEYSMYVATVLTKNAPFCLNIFLLHAYLNICIGIWVRAIIPSCIWLVILYSLHYCTWSDWSRILKEKRDYIGGYDPFDLFNSCCKKKEE